MLESETETIKIAPDSLASPSAFAVLRPGREGHARRSASEGHRLRWWRDAMRRRFLALADICAAVIATLLATSASTAGLVLLLGVPLWILLAKTLGLYDRDHLALRHLTSDEIPSLLAWVTVGVGGLALLAPETRANGLEAGAAVVAWAGGVASVAVLRSFARAVWRRAVPPETTLIVGEADLAAVIERRINLFPDMHLRMRTASRIPLPGNGTEPEDLSALLEGVDRVIVASRTIGLDPVSRLASECRALQVKLSIVSPLRGHGGAMPYLSQVADLPVLEFDTSDVSRSTVLLKRGFDIAVSSVALLILAPLFPLVALAIRLDSPGPTVFSQLRAGLWGESFRMYKLRSMFRNAEDRLPELIDIDALRQPAFKLRDDPRVTRVGRVLRRFSLDELPQLWNVLRGEMSIVGPRPEELALVERYQPEHLFRLQVKPGMTGPMQVFGRAELSFEERLAVELDYVERISLARDFWILLQTLPATLRGTGAF